MRKRIAGTLAVIMIIALIIPTFNVFAVGDLNMSALQLFLDKLANMEEVQRQLGATILEGFFAYGDEGIDELKDSLDDFISNDSLKEYGYSISDVKRELNRLKDWSEADRAKLVGYIESGNTSRIESIILKNEESNSEDSEGSGAVDSQIGDSEAPEEDLIVANFTDISGHWAKDSIEFLANKGIINGKAEGIFDPEGRITRTEFTALVVRLFDLRPQDDKTMNFTDMKSGTWDYEAVKAAYDNEIINGINENNFGPLNNITREQMIAIIIRVLEQRDLLIKIETTNKDLGLFSDKEQISSWAIDSMSQAVKYGILSGRSNNTLAPKENASRAEAANIMMILYNIINN